MPLAARLSLPSARGGAAPTRPGEPFARTRRSHAWSLKLGKLAGIDVYAHGTFLLLLAWLAGSSLVRGAGLRATLESTGLIVAVFAVVVLHELGHALAARRFGIRTRDILLLPFGGIASLERIPDKPWQELVVAAAGPAVNVGLAAIFFSLAALAGEPLGASAPGLEGTAPLASLAWVNVSLAAFNVLPAFPMDGGRVLRGLLGLRLPIERATEIAARVGQVMAILFAMVGVLASPMLLFIALFVWLGAKQELDMVLLKALLRGVPAASAMTTRWVSVDKATPLGVALQAAPLFEQTFVVAEGDRLVGVLTKEEVVTALRRSGPQARIGDAVAMQAIPAEAEDMLDELLERLTSERAAAAVIGDVDAGVLGIVTRATIAEVVAARSALRRWAGPTRP